jgi:large subunit ribosomal protein L21
VLEAADPNQQLVDTTTVKPATQRGEDQRASSSRAMPLSDRVLLPVQVPVCRLGGRFAVDSIPQAMYAVIASGGKQEKVTEGQQVELELLAGDEGSEVSLAPVLLVDGEHVLAGAEALAGVSVTGKIVGTTKGPKINGFTYKRRTNNRRRYGHRQNYTVVEITSITKS